MTDEPSSGAAPAAAPIKFDTFTGVFTPTVLTILGVIMFVRLPWVVGNGGILGSFAVMGLAMGITLCTGLSLSSIATNTRVGAGGPYAMITRSLGLEVGGSIGVPLYLSRPLGIAMYVFGFREGIEWVLMEYGVIAGPDPWLALGIDMTVFVALFTLSYLSANVAFRVQFLIMAVVALALVSIVATPRLLDPQGSLTMFGDWRGFAENDFAEGADFWIVFAVFFPATTGILAGANMSGDLKNPRKSIALGTMWAIVVSAVIYFGLALFASWTTSTEDLLTNYNVFIDNSWFGLGVLAGLLGATFSSALASAVGGPRILMAMGQNRIMPKSKWWAKTSARGEPRNAIMLTAVLTFGCLMTRDLNTIAPLVTMFFLITYLMINVVLLVENSLGLVSFRPSMRVPRLVPLLGALGCVFTMFIVNPAFGLVAVATSIAIYIGISRLGLGGKTEDVRSSVFESMADWAAAKVVQFGGKNVRSWKPDILMPIEDASLARGSFRFLVDIVRPEGSLNLLALKTDKAAESLTRDVADVGLEFREHGVFTRWALVICEGGFGAGMLHGLQALQSAFFRPNILFLVLPREPARQEEQRRMIIRAHQTGVGVLSLGRHPKAGLGASDDINIWIRHGTTGWNVDDTFDQNNLDLALLMGFRLARSWDARLTVITATEDAAEHDEAEAFLREICDLARLPEKTTTVKVMVGPFLDCAKNAPHADLNILGLQADPDFDFFHRVIERTGSTCLFVADSGRESARA